MSREIIAEYKAGVKASEEAAGQAAPEGVILAVECLPAIADG